MTQTKYIHDLEGMRPLDLAEALKVAFPDGIPAARSVQPKASLVIDIESQEVEGGVKFRWIDRPDTRINPFVRVTENDPS